MMPQLDQYAEIILQHQQAEREDRLEHSRLVHEALANHRVRFYQPLLIGLGRQMVIWGTQLQRTSAAPDMTLAAQPK